MHTVKAGLHIPPRRSTTFSSPLHDKIMIALSPSCWHTSQPQQWAHHRGQRRPTFKWGQRVRSPSFSRSLPALKLMGRTHTSVHERVCVCGRDVHWKVKNQPTSSLRRRRGEESRVLGVGGWHYKYSKQYNDTLIPCSETSLFAIICIRCQCGFVHFHTSVGINLHLTLSVLYSAWKQSRLYFNERGNKSNRRWR